MKKINTSLSKLVSILNDGHYHDGTSIGEQLNITRSAVWKAIKKLEAYGIKIDCIKGKGYALLEPLILLDGKIIKEELIHKQIDLMIFENIHSTNDYLKNLSHANKIKVCLAEFQTQGKGRLQRTWYSPFAQNIYFSCSYAFKKDVSELAGLSLIVSLAIAKTLELYHLPESILVKWPNDIIYHHKKLSGNLIEIRAESHGISQAIIGIGINVNMLEDESNINQEWTSLRKITGNHINRNHLCGVLINYLINYLQSFEKNGLGLFIGEWNNVDSLKNKMIALKHDNKKIEGISLGIDQLGHLKLKTEAGVKSFSSGDTTILK